MSQISIDHTANINRIIAILKSNTTIYNLANPKDKLRKIFFAETNYNLEDDSTPYAFVQIADDYEFTREPYGTANTNFLQSPVAYNVVIVVQQKEIAETQQQIFYFQNLVVQLLRQFPTLDDPANPGHPLAARCNILSQNRLEAQHGMEKDGVKIVIQYMIGSAFTMTLPSPIGTVNLLSVPINEDNLDTDIDLLDDASQVITGKAKPGSIAIEFESTPAIDAQLKTLKDAGNEISVTLSYGSDNRARTVVLTGIRKPVPFDNIERTVLMMDVVQ